jgi:hypothetical protein
VKRTLAFYTEKLGFTKKWPAEGVDWTVCQVDRGECEIILCQDDKRRDRARVFIELTDDGRADLRRLLEERAVPNAMTWWGYDCIQVLDPDGNELLFPVEG